jgi:subtilase family serine protease
VDYAASVPGVVAISNSYGSAEFSTETSLDSHYNHPGFAVTVSSGDNGYGVQYPAASPYVTAVGGTTLTQTTNTGTRNATETVWTGAGSGCSAYETKPSWQSDPGCRARTVADVAAVSDPNTGVWVRYNAGWYIFGGTSVAAPIVASAYSLAGAGGNADAYPVVGPYSNLSGLFDIVTGSNGGCAVSYLCTGVQGYDGPSGMGTPNGLTSFSVSSALMDFSLVANPASVTFAKWTTTSTTITLSPGSYSGSVNLSVSGLPRGVAYTFSSSTLSATHPASVLTFTTSPSVKAGSGTFRVTGVATGGATRAVYISLNVK